MSEKQKAHLRITLNFKNKQYNLEIDGNIEHLQHDNVPKMGESLQLWVENVDIDYAINITPEVDKVIESVAAIIVMPSGKLLMVQRKGDPYDNYWCLAGGKVDPNETPEQACVREVKEETGLDVAIIHKIGSYVEYAKYRDILCEFRPTLFSCVPIDQKQKPKKQETEIRDISEFSLFEATKSRLAFSHNKMIKDYIEYYGLTVYGKKET